jgi:hypothetical protein
VWFKCPKQEFDTASLFLHHINLDIFALYYIMSELSFFQIKLHQANRRISNGSTISRARGLGTNNYLTWLLRLTWLISSGAERCKTTRMMTCVKSKTTKTLEFIIQIISRRLLFQKKANNNSFVHFSLIKWCSLFWLSTHFTSFYCFCPCLSALFVSPKEPPASSGMLRFP